MLLGFQIFMAMRYSELEDRVIR